MTLQLAAQIAANADPDVGRALHCISLMQGRLQELQAAIAGQDARKRAATLTEIAALVDQLRALGPREAAA
jgi:hypothetical protein